MIMPITVIPHSVYRLNFIKTTHVELLFLFPASGSTIHMRIRKPGVVCTYHELFGNSREMKFEPRTPRQIQ